MYTLAAEKLFPTEAYSQVVAENHTEPNTYDLETDDDEEETLSFCDFSVENESLAVDTWNDSSRDSQNTSSSKSSLLKQDDYFEFCTTQLWRSKTSPHDPVISKNSEKPQKFPGKSKQRMQEAFRQKGSDNSMEDVCNHTNIGQRRSNDRSFMVQKLSPFSSSRKSKWYLFVSGSTRIRTQMELKDMKNRQSRRRCELLTLNGGDDVSKSMGRSDGFYLSGLLLRALSCGGHPWYHSDGLHRLYFF